MEDLDAALFALDIAIQTEKDGRAFYLQAAQTTEDPRGRELFQRLADDELEHLAIVEERKRTLGAEGKWTPFTENLTAHVPGATIFSKPVGEAELGAYTSDLTALRTAYLLEKDAVAFYSHAAEQTKDAEGKRMYQALVDMEKQHQQALETEYELLSDQFKLKMGFAPF